MVRGAHAITGVHKAGGICGVFIDKFAVDGIRIVVNDLPGYVIPDGQIRMGLEYDLNVRKVRTPVGVSRQVDDLDPLRVGEFPVGNP